MEFLVVIFKVVYFGALAVAIYTAVESKWSTALKAVGVFAASLVAALYFNAALIAHNAPPAIGGGLVVQIVQRLHDGSTDYAVKLDNNVNYQCVDGAMKCADLKLNEVYVGHVSAPDGWKWVFTPKAMVER